MHGCEDEQLLKQLIVSFHFTNNECHGKIRQAVNHNSAYEILYGVKSELPSKLTRQIRIGLAKPPPPFF